MGGSFGDRAAGLGTMKTLQATCIVGAITFIGIHQVGPNMPGVTVPDAMPEAAVSAETPGAPALCASVPEASAGPGTALGAELGSVVQAGFRTVVDGQGRNRRRFYRNKIGGLGRLLFLPAR